MKCVRCYKRITTKTSDFNDGYCNSCIREIGRELLSMNLIDIEPLNAEWRETQRTVIIDLLQEMKDVGMLHPFSGLTPNGQAFAHRIIESEKLKEFK